jgi:hypothetical protein
MAEFLDVEQGTVSKFESLELEGKLNFIILYAYALGYHIDVDTASPDELSCFQERQLQIRNELSSLTHNYIEDINSKIPRRKVTARSSAIARKRKGLLKKLPAAKKRRNLTGVEEELKNSVCLRTL